MSFPENGVAISKSAFDAAIFDLDGVVTQTVKIHAAAWKALFDEFLGKEAQRLNEPIAPFDPGQDYRDHLDGRPRDRGIKSFLASRALVLPYGEPQDPPDRETICGLGNRKNLLFQEILEKQGVEAFASTIRFILRLRDMGFRIAVVSSSKNCRKVLQAAQIENLFDVRVDGQDAEALQLEGKPAPEILLEAARRMKAYPKRTIVVEDSNAGVQAGSRGKFGLVIGLATDREGGALTENGADWVLSSLANIEVRRGSGPAKKEKFPPSALGNLAEIRGRMQGRRPALFLDYDGTLAPIVDRPGDALMPEETRKILKDLVGRCPVAVISGRDLQDIRARVKVEGAFYAGSHGFEIAFPDGKTWEHSLAINYLSVLDQAEKRVSEELRGISGAWVERKKFSLAVHYRLVPEHRIADMGEKIASLVRDYPELREIEGKKIFELQPRIDWHKGKALLLLLETMGLDKQDVLPLYFGDDATDEDAFRVLQDRGLGVLVEHGRRPTAAHYSLKNPEEVQILLRHTLSLIPGKGSQ